MLNSVNCSCETGAGYLEINVLSPQNHLSGPVQNTGSRKVRVKIQGLGREGVR